MNWDVITGSAEVLGALAVLITLIYLAQQIRQNTEEVRSANYHSVTDSFNEINLTLAGNPELARVFRLGNDAYEDLAEDERFQYNFFMHAAFRVLDVIKFQSQKGTNDMTLWDFERKTLDVLLEGAAFSSSSPLVPFLLLSSSSYSSPFRLFLVLHLLFFHHILPFLLSFFLSTSYLLLFTLPSRPILPNCLLLFPVIQHFFSFF